MVGVTTLLVSTLFMADGFDTSPAWPFCGRIADNPPQGWVEDDGCPSARHGDADYDDYPISSNFGPRQLGSESDRYDWHRGLDIPADCGTPLFATSFGYVTIGGAHSSYSDLTVQIRHWPPGHEPSSGGSTTCSSSYDGCYHTNYGHMAESNVSTGDWVERGDLIGWSGFSGIGKAGGTHESKCTNPTGYEHLHFEIRNSGQYGSNENYSRWSRDSIHPLQYFIHDEGTVPSTALVIDSVDTTTLTNPIVEATLTLASDGPLDLAGIEVEVYDNADALVTQTGATADAKGYYVDPPWLKMDEQTWWYTHKNSGSYSWASFDDGGANECPYHADHPSSYTANAHLDDAKSGFPKIGEFNGLEIEPAQFNGDPGSSRYTEDYVLTLKFEELEAPSCGPRCIKVKADFYTSNDVTATWGACP